MIIKVGSYNRKYLYYSIIMFIFAIIGLICAIKNYENSNIRIFIALLLVFIFIVTGVIPFLLEKKIDLFSPIILFMLLRIDYIGRPLILLLKGEYHNLRLIDYPMNDALDLLIKSLIMIIIGNIAYLLGYYYKKSDIKDNEKSRRKFEWKTDKVLLVKILLIIVFIASYLLIIRKVGDWKTMWSMMGHRRELYKGLKLNLLLLNFIPQLIFIVFSVKFLKMEKLPKKTYMILLIFIVMLSATGSRTRVLTFLLSSLIFLNYAYKKINVKNLIVFTLIVITLAVGLQDIRRLTTVNNNISISKIMENRNKHVVEEFILRRTTMDSVGVMMYILPEKLDFQYGKTFLNSIFFLIPRSIWKGKPMIDESGIIGKAFLGEDYYGLPVGMDGIFYLNFHYIGVFFGMMLIGKLHRRFYLGNVIYSKSYKSIGIYSIGLYYMMNISARNIVYLSIYILTSWLILNYVEERVSIEGEKNEKIIDGI